jgi:molecular chaperone DnaJ
MDYYEILGLSKSAKPEEIKKAYRSLARKYHPDVNKDKSAEKKFKEISEAYAVLSDPQKKDEYDRLGHDNFTKSGQGYDFNNMNYEDLRNFNFGGMNLDDLLGDILGGGRSARKSTSPAKGSDIQYSVEVSLSDIINGAEAEFNLTRTITCPTCKGKGGDRAKCPVCKGAGQTSSNSFFASVCQKCGGEGYIKTNRCAKCGGNGEMLRSERIKVKIPKGVDNNSKIRLRGKGNAGRNGGPSGDLYIIPKIAAHPVYERDGDNINLKVDIDMFEALLGAKIQVPTPYGAVSISIPAATQEGQKFRLKGRGIPKSKGAVNGDLFVQVHINIPTITNEADKQELLALMAKYSRPDRTELIRKGTL